MTDWKWRADRCHDNDKYKYVIGEIFHRETTEVGILQHLVFSIFWRYKMYF